MLGLVRPLPSLDLHLTVRCLHGSDPRRQQPCSLRWIACPASAAKARKVWERGFLMA